MNAQILPDLDVVDPTNPDHRSKIIAHAERLLRATGWRVVDQFDKALKGSTIIMYGMDVVRYKNNPVSGEEVAAELHDALVTQPTELLGSKKLLRTTIEVNEQAGRLLLSSIMVSA